MTPDDSARTVPNPSPGLAALALLHASRAESYRAALHAALDALHETQRALAGAQAQARRWRAEAQQAQRSGR